MNYVYVKTFCFRMQWYYIFLVNQRNIYLYLYKIDVYLFVFYTKIVLKIFFVRAFIKYFQKEIIA